MTLKEKIICTAYTGFNFCSGNDYCEFRKYADGLMGRPYQDIEMINEGYWNKLRALSRPDFDRMINSEYENHWTPVTESLPDTDGEYLVTTINDCGTRRRQVSSFVWFPGENKYSWGIETGPVYKVLAWMSLPEIWEG